ncbi:MAG: hypothetical protein KAS32_21865 [Candidatus Peribacteraceae bacterium]|nr:hypothetical protein [Candidatus Peribacteraceae bacterium]
MTNKNDTIIKDFLEKFVDLMIGELSSNTGIVVQHDKEANKIVINAAEYSMSINLDNVTECYKGTRNGVIFEILDLLSKVEDVSPEDRFKVLGHIKTKLIS